MSEKDAESLERARDRARALREELEKLEKTQEKFLEQKKFEQDLETAFTDIFERKLLAKQQELEMARENLQQLEAKIIQQEAEARALEKLIDLLEKKTDKTADENKELDEQKARLQEIINLTRELKDEKEKEEEATEKSSKTQAIYNKEQQAMRGASEATKRAIQNKTAEITGFSGGVARSTLNIHNMRGAMQGLGQTFMGFARFGFLDILAGLGKMLISMVFDLDDMYANFARSTGKGNEFRNMMAGVQSDTVGTHMSMQELSEAMRGLVIDYANFLQIGEKLGRQLGVEAAQLELIGLSSQATYKNLNFLQKAMGATLEEARKMNKDLFKMADGLNKAPEQLAKEFQDAAPIIARYTKEAGMSIFKNLQLRAKAAGMEVAKLNQMVGQYDTFEGAAAAAGTLNAFLGGPYLNTVRLVQMNESERFDAIKAAMDASGKSFDQMARYEKMGIAKQLGLSVDEASKMFRMSSVELGTYRDNLAEAQKKELDYARRAKEIAPVLRELQLAFREIGLALVDALFLDGVEGETTLQKIQNFVKDFKAGIPDFIEKIKSVAKTIMTFIVVGAIGQMIIQVGFMIAQYKTLLSLQAAAAMGGGPAGMAGGAGRAGAFGAARAGFGTGLQNFALGASRLAGPLAIAGLVGYGLYKGYQAFKEGGRSDDARDIGARLNKPANDFVYTGDGTASGGMITPINENDKFIGYMPGGGIDKKLDAMIRELRDLNKNMSKSGGSAQPISIDMDGEKVAKLVYAKAPAYGDQLARSVRPKLNDKAAQNL